MTQGGSESVVNAEIKQRERERKTPKRTAQPTFINIHIEVP